MTLFDEWQGDLRGAYSRNETIAPSGLLANPGVFTSAIARETDVASADLRFDGPIMQVPGGTVKIALGGHYRHEALSDIFADQGFPEPITHNNALENDLERDVFAMFAEIYAPLVSSDNRSPGIERLELSLSGRFEEYSDFGSTIDPKIGLSWSPVESLSLRGSWGTSFRAPLLSELDESLSTYLLINSVEDPQDPDGSLVAYVFGSGTPSLQPESATTWSTGFDYEPEWLSGLKLSATYFDIDFKDRIAKPDFFVLDVLVDPLYAPVLDFTPDPALLSSIDPAAPRGVTNLSLFVPAFGPPAEFVDAEIIADGRVQNLSREHVKGLDFSIAYGVDAEEMGYWNLNVSGTYLFDDFVQLFVTDPGRDRVDTINNPVDLRLDGNLSWSQGGFSANVGVDYVDGYLNDRNAPLASVSSWTTANLGLIYDTGHRIDGALANTRFLVNINNLFDRNPPLATTDLTVGSTAFSPVLYDPNAANVLGRVISFQMVKNW